MLSTSYEPVYTLLRASACMLPASKQSHDAAFTLCCVHTDFKHGKCVSYHHGPKTGDQCFAICYRAKSWKPCVLQRLTSILYTVVMVPMTSAQPWHLLPEMLCWQERCVTVTCNSAHTFAADVMWCIMPLVVLVLLLSVVVGGLHVCISLHHAAIAKS